MSTRQHAGPAPSSGLPEPSLAERARTLAEIAQLGSLSTHSRKFAGFPFGSMMPYAVDASGRPLFFISSMAMHTQNLASDPRASLLILQPAVTDDPLGAARLTLVGNAVEVTAEEAAEPYLARHEQARYWKDFSDFAYYRLEVAGVYYIGGFGVMGWIDAPAYTDAAPDPLAHAAAGIIAHMNADHAATLVRIANRFGSEKADEASITAVDRLGFHVRMRSGDRVHGARIAFPREARSSDEARRMFVEMVREARSLEP